MVYWTNFTFSKPLAEEQCMEYLTNLEIRKHFFCDILVIGGGMSGMIPEGEGFA